MTKAHELEIDRLRLIGRLIHLLSTPVGRAERNKRVNNLLRERSEVILRAIDEISRIDAEIMKEGDG